MNRKEQLHAIGNYLLERFDYKWRFSDEESSFPITILIEDIDVYITYENKREAWLVYTKQGDGTKGKYLDSPLQVIFYILNRKYEEI